ncbi:hypothetical protein I4U23_019796 [Adineta vaga]|nr:hypothetical protein I4U23_019796 [Adineta vaga]
MPVNRDTILRVILCTHFIFVSVVLIADWLPKAYLLNQVTILAIGILAIIHHESVIEIELLILFKFISIIIDSITIAMYFDIGKSASSPSRKSAYFTISVSFAIILLILKPIMLLVLIKIRQERLNNAVFESWTTRSGYTPVGDR